MPQGAWDVKDSKIEPKMVQNGPKTHRTPKDPRLFVVYVRSPKKHDFHAGFLPAPKTLFPLAEAAAETWEYIQVLGFSFRFFHTLRED